MKQIHLVLVALIVLVVSTPAAAHSGVQSYVYVSVFDDGAEGRVEYPIADLAEVLAIDLPDRAATIEDLDADRRATIVDYTRSHLSMEHDAPWVLDFDGTVTYLGTENGGYVLVHFDVLEPAGEIPRSWTVTYDGIFEAMPERDALLVIEDDFESATFRNEAMHLVGFSIGNETQLIELGSASTLDTVQELARRGRLAVNRSLIVIVSLLAVTAAAVLRHRSRPGSATWRSTGVEVVVRIVAVVVAQSAMLWLLGLGGVEVGLRPALVLGGLAALLGAASWWMPDRWGRLAAVGVGLLSGVWIGGSFVLQQLHRSSTVTSLAGFDLGALIMATAFAVALLPLLAILATTSAATTIGRAVAGLAGLVGTVWLVEGLLGPDLGLRDPERRVADVLSSPLPILAVTAVAAAAVFLRATSSSATGADGPTVERHGPDTASPDTAGPDTPSSDGGGSPRNEVR